MTRKPTEGWAGIVDFEDDDTPVDGVVRGPEEDEPAPTAPPPSPRPTSKISPSRPQGPSPRQPLRLPTAGKPRGSRERSAPAPASAESPTFSHQELVDKLTDLNRPDRSAPPVASFWKEYRELLATALVGALLLGSVFAYRALSSGDPSVPATGHAATQGQTTPADAGGGARDAAPLAAAPEPPPPPPDETPPPQKAAIPMASIVSEPSGATVEIEGEVVGKTPLILPAPPGRTSMHVRLELPGRTPWQGVVEANEGGHFVVSQELFPKR